MQGNTGNFIKFRKGNLNYTGPVDLTQYYIESYDILDDDQYTMTSTNGRRGVYVKMVLGRRLLNLILTNFLPCIFICIVVFSTNYFKVMYSSFPVCHSLDFIKLMINMLNLRHLISKQWLLST